MSGSRDMRARLVLSLRDGLSPGLDRIQGRLDRLRGAINRIAGAAAIGTALSFAGPIQQAAAFEGSLRDIAVTAGHTGDAVTREVARMRDALHGTALQFRESSRDLGAGLGVLIARGLDPDRVQALLPVMAEIRSASGAATSDLGQLIVAYDRIAQIAPDQQRQALAVAFRAGQLGGAELRDMSRYLPGILAQYGALGVTGMRVAENASALFQVLRDGFGTTEEAAAGFQQLIGHLMSDATVRRMREYGIDLRQVYQNALNAMRRGEDIDPVEAIFQRIRGVLAEDPARAFEIMPDQNSRQALLAWVAGVDRYLDIRNQLRAATPAVVEQASTDRMVGLAAELRLFSEQIVQLGDRLGNALAPQMALLNAGLAEALSLIKDLDARFPGLIDGTVGWGAAILAGVTGLAVLVKLLGFLRTGLLIAAAPFAALGGFAGGLAAAAVAAAGGAYLVWKNWDEVKAWFSEFGAWATAWGSDVLGRVWAGIQRDVEALTELFGGGALGRRFRSAMEDIGQGIATTFERAREIVQAVAGPIIALIERVQAFRGSTEAPLTPEQRAANWRARVTRVDEAAMETRATYGEGTAARNWRGNLRIDLAPGLVLREATTNAPGNITLTPGDRGLITGRP